MLEGNRKRLGRVVAVLALAALSGATAAEAEPRYPDLKTLTPYELQFDTEPIDGSTHWVLRFSNTIWNAGEGPLTLQGWTYNNKTRVYQRVYDGSTYTSYYVGEFVYHPDHQHFHLEDFSTYELWTRSEYDEWIASGRKVGAARKRGTKTSFCLEDSFRYAALPGSPTSERYYGCGTTFQGISVGWADEYRYSLPGQWIDLGTSRLPNGNYVLRTVADPLNRLYESANKATTSRESHLANEGVLFFNVRKGRIRY